MPKTPDDHPEPQQIGYINVMPECIDTGGFLSHAKFEPFGDALNKLNTMLKQRPLPGENISKFTNIKHYL